MSTILFTDTFEWQTNYTDQTCLTNNEYIALTFSGVNFSPGSDLGLRL